MPADRLNSMVKDVRMRMYAAGADHVTVGCRLEALWAANIEVGKPKATRLCVVSKHKLYRKSRKNK